MLQRITIYRNGFLVLTGWYDPPTGKLFGFGGFHQSTRATIIAAIVRGDREFRTRETRARYVLDRAA